MSDYYPANPDDLRKQGTKGVMAAAGGVGLWVVSGLLNIPVLGWIIAGGLVVLGVTGVFGKTKTDKPPGGLMMAAGAAGIAALVLPGLTHFLLGAGGLALVAFGAWNIFKFVRGLKTRA